jgi:hypothetical protein
VSAGVHPPRCFVHWENAERSPERALLLAGRDDVVVVGGAVDRDHLDYLASLDVGPRAENVLVASSPADPELPARIVDLARGAQGMLLCPATGRLGTCSVMRCGRWAPGPILRARWSRSTS